MRPTAPKAKPTPAHTERNAHQAAAAGKKAPARRKNAGRKARRQARPASSGGAAEVDGLEQEQA